MEWLLKWLMVVLLTLRADCSPVQSYTHFGSFTTYSSPNCVRATCHLIYQLLLLNEKNDQKNTELRDQVYDKRCSLDPG